MFDNAKFYFLLVALVVTLAQCSMTKMKSPRSLLCGIEIGNTSSLERSKLRGIRLLSIRLNINADQQSGSKVITTATRNPPPPIPQGKAAGESIPFARAGEDIREAIMGHPFPKVWLTFTTSSKQGPPQSDSPDSGESTVKVELPDEANQLLRTYWQTYLNATYNMDIKGMPDAESYRSQMVIADRSADDTEQKLMKIDIEAPNGRRKISLDEARDLTSLISGFAKDIINQAKAR
jgi:hypothetical protein